MPEQDPGRIGPTSKPPGRSATLRIVLEGTPASIGAEILHRLARQVDGTVASRTDSGSVLEWLAYEAGLFEERPLRLEVATVAGGPGAVAGLRGLADVVVLVVDAAGPEGVAAGRAVSEEMQAGWRWVDAVDVSALMVFAHRREGVGGLEPQEVLGGLGLGSSVPVVATAADGTGVRYGFALAVRACLQRVHARDLAGRPRSTPLDLDELLALVTAASAPAHDAEARPGGDVADEERDAAAEPVRVDASPETASPETALHETALPETGLPETAVAETAVAETAAAGTAGEETLMPAAEAAPADGPALVQPHWSGRNPVVVTPVRRFAGLDRAARPPNSGRLPSDAVEDAPVAEGGAGDRPRLAPPVADVSEPEPEPGAAPTEVVDAPSIDHEHEDSPAEAFDVVEQVPQDADGETDAVPTDSNDGPDEDGAPVDGTTLPDLSAEEGDCPVAFAVVAEDEPVATTLEVESSPPSPPPVGLAVPGPSEAGGSRVVEPVSRADVRRAASGLAPPPPPWWDVVGPHPTGSTIVPEPEATFVPTDIDADADADAAELEPVTEPEVAANSISAVQEEDLPAERRPGMEGGTDRFARPAPAPLPIDIDLRTGGDLAETTDDPRGSAEAARAVPAAPADWRAGRGVSALGHHSVPVRPAVRPAPVGGLEVGAPAGIGALSGPPANGLTIGTAAGPRHGVSGAPADAPEAPWWPENRTVPPRRRRSLLARLRFRTPPGSEPDEPPPTNTPEP